MIVGGPARGGRQPRLGVGAGAGGARSLNVEGARAHVLTDLYASLGAALAGAIILTTGFR